MDHIGFVTIDGEELSIHVAKYSADNSPAIELMAEDGPYARFTVCIEDSNLAPGELLVKTWNENDALREPMLGTGLFEDTGRRVTSGYVSAEVWRFRNAA